MIRPRGQLVLMRRLPKTEKKTKGGLAIPDYMKRSLMEAEVLRIGAGYYDSGVHQPVLDLKVGDRVLLQDDPPIGDPRNRQKAHIPVTADENEFLVSETRIYAVIEPDEPEARA